MLQWASFFLITDHRAYCIARHPGRGGSLPSSATWAKSPRRAEVGLTRWTRFALPRSGCLEGDWLGEPRIGGRRLVQVLGADDGEILFLTAWGGGRHLAKPLRFVKLCGNGLPSGSRPSIFFLWHIDWILGYRPVPSDEAELDPAHLRVWEGSDVFWLSAYRAFGLYPDAVGRLLFNTFRQAALRNANLASLLVQPNPNANASLQPYLIHTSASQRLLESSKPLLTLGIVGFLSFSVLNAPVHETTVHQTSPTEFRFLVRFLPGSRLWAWTSFAQPGQTVLSLKWHGRAVEKVLVC